MKTHFYSNGKLLLTGEYLVLDGALSLAIPTFYGQTLSIQRTDTSQIVWKSFNDVGEIWFQAKIALSAIKDQTNAIDYFSWSSEEYRTEHKILYHILLEAYKMNPEFLNVSEGFSIETKLDFPKNWGLGSSSTLLNNIASWAKVDAHELLRKTLGGSGYDVACAQNDMPILYRLLNGIPEVRAVTFNPPFSDQLFFVHLNKKQNSGQGIEYYRKLNTVTDQLIERVSGITRKIVDCVDFSHFNDLLMDHESILSHMLQIPRIQATTFSDFPGAIKSLGAWGGDFIMATGDTNTPDYFKRKGYKTVIPFSKMILH